MSKDILFVGTSSVLSDRSKNNLLSLTTVALNSNCGVHIFREDTSMYDVLRNTEGVKALYSIDSGSDKLLYGKTHDSFYLPTDKIICERFPSDDIYNKAISRFPAPSRSDTYDNREYVSRRYAVIDHRIRRAISSISDTYKFIIVFSGTREMNLLPNVKSEDGDGRFIYIYDTIKDRATFTVGGFSIPEEEIIKCIKEVTQW